MIVIAKYEFEPDTSWMKDSEKQDGAIEITHREIESLIQDGLLTADDFTYEVIDDGDDHKID